MKTNKLGFTLIEMLVVVLIVGVLAAVAIPGYMKAMEKSKAVEAIQALSDIAKAENDYYNAQSKYTDDFEDMDIKVFADTTGDTHEGKYFTYTLEDETAVAERNGGDDPYTLYRVYDDPRTYCQPESNKYCKILGLPAGDRNSSIGNWQSCSEAEGGYPCTKACARNTTTGYTCMGTYNEDGTFTEKVCDDRGYCVISEYNKDQNAIKKNFCYEYNENGICIAGSEKSYDENGNLLNARKCVAWSEDNLCTEYDGGFANTFDENGNHTSFGYCTTWNSEGICTKYNWGYALTYDEYGNITSYGSCSKWNSDGTCQSRGPGKHYDYDENGNLINEITCQTWNSDGTCKTVRVSGYEYKYDENGNEIAMIYCKTRNSDGSCAEYNVYGTVYEYDENGNQTASKRCISWNTDGTCAAYGADNYRNAGTVYQYDENGRKIYQATCAVWGEDGNCSSYNTSTYGMLWNWESDNKRNQINCYMAADGTCPSSTSGWVSTYDSNGNVLTSIYCTKWTAERTCEKYGTQGSVYTYDSNGNRTSAASCTGWSTDGVCTSYATNSSSDYVYTYDVMGNQTGYKRCTTWTSDGTCTNYGPGYIYVYDESGNQTGRTYCTEWNADGSCGTVNSRECYYVDSFGDNRWHSC